MTTFLHALSLPFLAVDRAIQRAVDAGAHALMRRGVSKGVIRYALSVFWVLTDVVEVAALWAYRARHPVTTIVYLLLMALYLAGAGWRRTLDARADAGGMLTPSEASVSSDFGWKAFAIASGVVEIVPGAGGLLGVGLCSPLQCEFGRWCRVAFQVVFLVILYLRRTPRVPPARQESRVPAHLATEGA